MDNKRIEKAFSSWALAKKQIECLRAISSIQEKLLKQQGFSVLTGNMEEHRLQKEQILDIINFFGKRRPENLLQF